MAGRTAALAFATLAVVSLAADGQRTGAAADAAHARYAAALDEIRTTGAKGTAVQAYLDSLPRAGGLYVIEGDMLMSETEVVQTYLTTQVAQGSLPPGPELKINLLPSGAMDRYDGTHRVLPYAIDRRTFNNRSQYFSVVKYMADATTAWERACPPCRLLFKHLPSEDAAPSPRRVNFIVRNFDAKGEYIAASFFPHDAPERRFLNLDPSYYSTSFDKIGVLRHELGHVLGYRHEHIAGVPGCYMEDSYWRPLTPYDSRSVMHYFCGGGGTLTLQLTPTDISGHRQAYLLR